MKAEDRNKIILQVYAIIGIIIYAAYILLYCFGFTQYYGKNVDVVEGLNLVFGILDIGSAYYRNIGGAALGTLYVVLLILLLKNVVSLIRSAKEFFGKNYKEDKKCINVFNLSNCIGKGDIYIIAFALISLMMKEYTMNLIVKLMILSGIVFYVVARILINALLGYTWKSILVQTGAMIVAIVALILGIKIFQMGTVEQFIMEFITGSRIIFADAKTGIAFWANATVTVVGIVAICNAIVFMHTLNDMVQYQEIKEYKKPTFLRMSAIIIVVMACVKLFLGSGSLEATSLLLLIVEYIPMFCVAFALQLVVDFKFEEELRAQKALDENIEVEEDGKAMETEE